MKKKRSNQQRSAIFRHIKLAAILAIGISFILLLSAGLLVNLRGFSHAVAGPRPALPQSTPTPTPTILSKEFVYLGGN